MKQRLIEHLPCKLTDEEHRLKSEQLAAKIGEIDALETQKKSVTADLKTKKESAEIAARSLATEVKTGMEIRPVVCEARPDYARGMVDLVRTDTFETVSTRALHPDEKQTEFDIASAVSSMRMDGTGTKFSHGFKKSEAEGH